MLILDESLKKQGTKKDCAIFETFCTDGPRAFLVVCRSRWDRGHFSMNKWESEKPKNWGMPAEGFKGHDATDAFLLGTA